MNEMDEPQFDSSDELCVIRVECSVLLMCSTSL